MSKIKETVYIGEISSTPLGPIWVAVSERGLVGVEVSPNQDALIVLLNRFGFQQVLVDEIKTAAATHQVSQYLQGERKTFDLPIDWSVLTPFQEQALEATYAIPYGEVMTYGEIAHQLGKPRAARAVGRAEATNPMPLVIPCHRVIGADGGLHGYGAGAG
ncbi:MAG: methylated-DNA--[protein]-cysteine S-methyltransferase, partial [Anaerolineales bacterium]|nr:methylated-DNA--[protein]-cysteine S-methyltransferase [Anaerolineales bacterium]